jgi:formate dehydrogenase subunit gamma
MAATTIRSERFSGGERLLHWVNSALFLFLLATAAALYAGPISALVGRRDLVRWAHVIAGLALPVPLVIAALRSAPFRADVRRLNRFTSDDWRWFRRRPPEHGQPKFNAGQKLNSAFVAGSIPVLLVTGAIMKWFEPFPLSWRTGATFVHDVVAIILLVAIVGHIVKALSDPPKLRAMWSGFEDAKRTHVR